MSELVRASASFVVYTSMSQLWKLQRDAVCCSVLWYVHLSIVSYTRPCLSFGYASFVVRVSMSQLRNCVFRHNASTFWIISASMSEIQTSVLCRVCVCVSALDARLWSCVRLCLRHTSLWSCVRLCLRHTSEVRNSQNLESLKSCIFLLHKRLKTKDSRPKQLLRQNKSFVVCAKSAVGCAEHIRRSSYDTRSR